MDIRRAKADQWGEAASMALLLWPSHPKEELEQEFQALLQNPDAAVFFAYEGNVLAGFAQCGLRRDYVEGSSTSPTGYLEGIFVLTGYREGAWQKRCWQNVKSGAGKKAAVKWVPIAHWKTGKAGSFICTAVFWKQGALSVLSRIWRTEDGSKTGVPSIATGL